MTKSRRPSTRRAAPVRQARPAARRRTAIPAPRRAAGADDTFFRHIVAGMRNGALALTREGVLTLINDEACRIFEIAPRRTDLGRPVEEVLKDHPEVVRLLTGVFDLHQLPNRAELRLRPSGKVLGYTLALVRDDAGCVVGASMFFKDLTRVEQIEERERLRDRLVALGGETTSPVRIPPAGIPLEDIERLALIEAPKMSNWVQKDAAELLAVSPRVMNYKIKCWGSNSRAAAARRARRRPPRACSPDRSQSGFPFRPRVGFPIHLQQLCRIHVRVALRRR